MRRSGTAETLPVLRLKGSARQMGLTQGRKARRDIQDNLEVYLKRFEKETELSKQQVTERAAKYLQVINRSNPEYAQAMKGVADGSGSDILDITALNVRYELMYSQFSKIGIKPLSRTFGCTAFGALPAVAKNGHLLMGQNWDWIPEVKGLFLKIRNQDAPDVLCFTEAGVVGGKIGVNSERLGLLINGIVSNRDDWSRLKKPFHVRCWDILRSRTLQEAVRAIDHGQRNCSANFVLGQQRPGSEARLVDVESAPEATCKLMPNRGAIGHTNHFMDPSPLGVEQVLDEERLSTLHRYKRIETLLEAKVRGGDRLDIATAQAMLRDHDGNPESICRHPNTTVPEDERYETVVSVLMDIYSRKLWATIGSPCTREYRTLQLN